MFSSTDHSTRRWFKAIPFRQFGAASPRIWQQTPRLQIIEAHIIGQGSHSAANASAEQVSEDKDVLAAARSSRASRKPFSHFEILHTHRSGTSKPHSVCQCMTLSCPHEQARLATPSPARVFTLDSKPDAELVKTRPASAYLSSPGTFPAALFASRALRLTLYVQLHCISFARPSRQFLYIMHVRADPRRACISGSSHTKVTSLRYPP